MDTASANLSHQVFGPGLRTQDGQLVSVAEGIVKRLVVYHWPRKNITDQAKLSVLAYFTAYGRSESISPSAWATWAFSYVTLAFEQMQGLARAQNDREFEYRPLPYDFIEAIVTLENACEDYDEHPEVYAQAATRVPHLPNIPDMPSNEETFPPELAATVTIPAVYGFAALIIFLAGKRINEKNASTITERRPMNLVNAYQIPDPATYCLTGDGKMGLTSHPYINQAWVTYAPMRIAVISEVARFSAGRSLAQRVVYTLVKMMEYSGMQQGTFIHEFLQARPEAVNFSCTRPSYNAYATSLREVASAPAHLQPFYKLIHGERTRAFHRNSILILSACATAYKKAITPSMINFQLGDGATPAVNMYDAEAASKGYSTIQGVSGAALPEQDAE
nr:hypothetical protein [Plasmopara viticola lesion associated mononegaambi virus 2]